MLEWLIEQLQSMKYSEMNRRCEEMWESRSATEKKDWKRPSEVLWLRFISLLNLDWDFSPEEKVIPKLGTSPPQLSNLVERMYQPKTPPEKVRGKYQDTGKSVVQTFISKTPSLKSPPSVKLN